MPSTPTASDVAVLFKMNYRLEQATDLATYMQSKAKADEQATPNDFKSRHYFRTQVLQSLPQGDRSQHLYRKIVPFFQVITRCETLSLDLGLHIGSR